ncbi:MAG: HAD hydrolase-like protein [Verrucomicrobiota bacterium]|nr:HAD hydrolase-like protein [Verrucomicrobiota bacterium]
MKSVLVFDMDGVLADVTGSYLAAIAATVRHFTNNTPSLRLIAEYKNAGGWNNDWALAQKLILDTTKLDVPYKEVVKVFQLYFLGANNDGLITREAWIPVDGLLNRLAAKHALAIFTGRPREEVDLTLTRFAPKVRWASIIADTDVANAKPAPDGLHMIAVAHSGNALTYVGDNVDDARSARAAGVRFIGVADADGEPILKREGASAVVRNVNELEAIL